MAVENRTTVRLVRTSIADCSPFGTGGYIVLEPRPQKARMATTEETRQQAIVDAVPKQLFVGGEWRDASGGGTLGVEDPSTGEVVADVADATVDDALAALGAATEAQAEWAATAPRDRGEILRGAYERLVERADGEVVLMTLEMGKPVAESK